MHRVRQSLPYFRELGWEPVVITVNEAYAEAYSRDELLLETIPPDVEVHRVNALSVKYTRKVGLGSLSMRAYWHIRKKGNELLRKHKFHLVYFSTTAFHVMALGPEWKKKFKVPFVLDIQDPWRNDFYLDKPKAQRPPKFLVAYNIDKYLEGRTVPFADGIISVSQSYIDTFISRYPGIKASKCRVITFGAAEKDLAIMQKHIQQSAVINFDPNKINLVYTGRGGHDMRFACEIIFKAIAKGLKEASQLFGNIHCWFAGTSYAVKGTGRQTIYPVAQQYGVAQYVTEITDRVPYFESLYLLNKADVLIVPGSTDTAYTASKIYPYIQLKKKMLAVFNHNSSIVPLLQQLQYGELVAFDHMAHTADDYVEECYRKLKSLLQKQEAVTYDEKIFTPCLASSKTKEQVALFDEIINEYA